MASMRIARRFLGTHPAFGVVALVSLAVGIGANTAIFSVVNAVLLRPLPVHDPHRLVLFRSIDGRGGRMARSGENNTGTAFSLLAFERMRAQRAPLAGLFAFAPFSQAHVVVDGDAESAPVAQMVSGSYFDVLGVGAALGRTIRESDDEASAAPVAVISYRYWERRFDRRADVLGRTILINRVPAAIVGVATRGFDGTLQAGESADITVPLAHYLRFQPDRRERAQASHWWVRVMGRLTSGATPAQASAALEPAFQDAAREGWLSSRGTASDAELPGLPALTADSGARGESDVRQQFAGSLWTLMGLGGVLLLAACANAATLLLAEGTAHRREIALRLALGASRQRVVGELFTHALLLALGATAFGIALAWWGRGWLLTLLPAGTTPLVLDVPLDYTVLAFTAGAVTVTALLFGLSPAVVAARVDLNAAFQSGGRTASARRPRLTHGVIVVQVALALVLLVGSGLFARTLTNLAQVDAGFNRRDLVLFRIDAASAGYRRDQFTALQSRLQRRLERVPGVRGVTFSSTALLSRVRQSRRVSVGERTRTDGALPVVNTNGLAPGFFSTMELPLLLGREFTRLDDASAPPVAVVNHTFVRTFLDSAHPIGSHIAIPTHAATIEIVGVSADAKYADLRAAVPPTVYLPALQQVDGNANFAVRIHRDMNPTAVYPALRAAVREIDPALPMLNLRTQDDQIDRLYGQERLFAHLSAVFGGLALLLASAGIYGLLSAAVLRRTREIGVRMALGARPWHVWRLFLRDSLSIAVAGLAVGGAAAAGAAHVVKSMLFGLSPLDRMTYLTAAAWLVAMTVLASVIPVRRALRIDPGRALNLK